MPRLEKLVAAASPHSRRAAAGLIKSGRVAVDGKTVTAPDYPCAQTAFITLDGAPLLLGPRYIMLNKPKGTICATKDDNGKTVLELIAEPLRKNLFPAGRLDKDSEGFVLLTDDGPFAHRLLSPRSRIPKTYLATLDRPPDKDILAELFCSPIDLGGGDITSPALLENVDGVTARLTIYEGMFHQVKRMFLKAGYKVEGLRRIRIGALELDPGLGPGEYRPILPGEMPLLIRQD